MMRLVGVVVACLLTCAGCDGGSELPESQFHLKGDVVDTDGIMLGGVDVSVERIWAQERGTKPAFTIATCRRFASRSVRFAQAPVPGPTERVRWKIPEIAPRGDPSAVRQSRERTALGAAPRAAIRGGIQFGLRAWARAPEAFPRA